MTDSEKISVRDVFSRHRNRGDKDKSSHLAPATGQAKARNNGLLGDREVTEHTEGMTESDTSLKKNVTEEEKKKIRSWKKWIYPI